MSLLFSVMTGTGPGESEHLAAQERFDVFAIQPYDEVLYVLVVHHNSFHGHDLA